VQYKIIKEKGLTAINCTSIKSVTDGERKMITSSAKNYIIVTQSAFGQVFLRKSDVRANRFVVEKVSATKFHDIGFAKDWLAEQKDSMNEQIFNRCKIIEEF